MSDVVTANRRRIFFVPLAYFIATRLGNGMAIGGWIAIYPIPILISVLPFVDTAGFEGWLALPLAMLAMYGLYELGYMDNDTRTTRLEARPTERLAENEKQFFQQRRGWLVLLRLLFVAATLLCIDLLLGGNRTGIAVLIAGLLVVALTFPVYNSVRGAVNLPLHLVLTSMRFCVPGLVLVVEDGFAGYVAVMWLAFPFINFLERAGEARFGLSWFAPLLAHRDLLRVAYYGVLFAGSLWFWWSGAPGVLALSVFGWLFVVRLLSFGLRGKT